MIGLFKIPLISKIALLIKSFKSRVTTDNGTFEAESCLKTTLTQLNNANVLQQASLVITPNAVKAGKLDSIIPTDGAGDLNVVRATSATRVNSAGLIETVGNNVARIDYSNGSCPSILVEPQRTNLFLRSEEFDNASWSKTNCTITANTTNAPNGTLTADTITNSSISNVYVNQTISGALINNFYTASCYFKKGSSDIARVALSDLSLQEIAVSFNITTLTLNTISSAGAGWDNISYGFTNSANGFVRLWLSARKIGPNSIVGVRAGFVTSIIGSFGYLWGAQLEAGSNVTSYIPTTTGSVTRNADVISKSGISNLIGQTEGSIYVEFERTTETLGFKHILTLYGDSWLTNSLFLQTPNNTDLNLSIRINSTAYQRNIGTGISGKNKLLLIYDTTGCDIFLNGTKLTRFSLPSFPSLYNLRLLNYLGDRQYGSGYLFSFWKTKLTDQQAIQLTTL